MNERLDKLVTEQERTEAFEQLVGGPERGFALMRLWERSVNPVGGNPFESKADKHGRRIILFSMLALDHGYTAEMIDTFLDLQ
jgi:hypothetical protein